MRTLEYVILTALVCAIAVAIIPPIVNGIAQSITESAARIEEMGRG